MQALVRIVRKAKEDKSSDNWDGLSTGTAQHIDDRRYFRPRPSGSSKAVELGSPPSASIRESSPELTVPRLVHPRAISGIKTPRAQDHLLAQRTDTPPLSPPLPSLPAQSDYPSGYDNGNDNDYGNERIEDNAKEWIMTAGRAQSYLDRCELDNADVLFDLCVRSGFKAGFAHTDIVLGSRMQRAVIKTMRGQFQAAIRELRAVRANCEKEIQALERENRASGGQQAAGEEDISGPRPNLRRENYQERKTSLDPRAIFSKIL